MTTDYLEIYKQLDDETKARLWKQSIFIQAETGLDENSALELLHKLGRFSVRGENVVECAAHDYKHNLM